jgi:hypothetical protein
MTEKSGRAVARANRLALQEKVKELTMNGTYGRTFFDSLEAVAPKSSWVSKLQERLGMVGSTESDLIWKVKTTPAKALIFRLAVSTRRTSDPDCIGWQTPTVEDASRQGNGDHWMKYKEGNYTTGCRLRNEIHAATTWPTPRSVDGDKGSRTPDGCIKEIERKGRLDDLPSMVTHSTWPTPTTRDGKDGSYCPNVPENALLGRTVWKGDEAQTEKRGALNPAFVCWLMGFPPEWESCAPTAMPSSRRSRQK